MVGAFFWRYASDDDDALLFSLSLSSRFEDDDDSFSLTTASKTKEVSFSFVLFSNSRMMSVESNFSPGRLFWRRTSREKFPRLRSKVSFSLSVSSDATLTFFSLLRLRNTRVVFFENIVIDRSDWISQGGECDDDIITKVSGTVDGAKRVRAHPRVLQRRHWYRSRHDELVRRGHGRQKRESYRKRGRVKDDAVHGGV